MPIESQTGRDFRPLFLSYLLLLTGCESADGDKILTECQGKITYRELRERSIEAGILWGEGRNLRVELAKFDEASCGVPPGKINFAHSVVPCDKKITWGEIVTAVEAQDPPYRGYKDGRGYLKAFTANLPVCNKPQ